MTQNDCKLAGYLGADVQLRFLTSGTPVATMRLGQSYHYTDQNKKEVRKTNWFSVVAYGPVAEIAKTFHKGDNVILEGNLETREWEAQDKSKRRVVEVIARNIGKLERTSHANGHDAPEGQDHGDDWPA